MADEPVVAAAGGAGGGAGGGESGGGMSAADIAAPGGDIAFLEQPTPEVSEGAEETKGAETVETKEAAKADGKEESAAEEIDLSKLEEGRPEWLAKVADPAVKAEVEKLLDLQKAFSEHFKDAEDLAAFFKELPGGKEQLAAMQTLVADVDQLDSALEKNTPEGNLEVAARYLEMTPDGGAGLLRAAAQHMANVNPEAWNQISTELINSTLHAAGFGFDLPGLVSAIREIKAAVAADDGEAWGNATGKLLGAPKAAPKTDPKLAEASEREANLAKESREARTETWQARSEKSGNKVSGHIADTAKLTLDKVLPATITQQERAKLSADIQGEVMSQLVADPWIASQVKTLIGWSNHTEKGADHSNANLKASQADWDKASKLMTDRATPKLIARAVAKVVSAWSTERANTNKTARAKAAGAATKTDVGAGPASKTNNGRKVLTQEMVKGPKALSDIELLNF